MPNSFFFVVCLFSFFPFLADWKISWCSGWLSNDPAAEHGDVQEVSGGSLLCAPPSSAGVWGRARQAPPVSRAGCTSGHMWHLSCFQSSFRCPPSSLMCLTIVTLHPVFFPPAKPFQERLPERPPELAFQLAESISLSPKIPLLTPLHPHSACQKTIQIFDGLKLGTRGT